MKEKNKILHFFVIFAIIMLVLVNVSFASPIIPTDIGPEMNNDTVRDTTSIILGTFRWIGLIIAIGMLMYAGIKYVMASADERASLKGLLVKIVVGVMIILAAELIVSVIYNF